MRRRDAVAAASLTGASALLVSVAYFRFGPLGPLGFLPFSLDYVLFGALGVATGCLGISYAVKLRGLLRTALIVVASLGIAGGLFFASMFLPVWVFYGMGSAR